ncbi:MAG: PSD1 and planctomycete cytochrome C domain-containing protein [Phycisphaerales bacterium]
MRLSDRIIRVSIAAALVLTVAAGAGAVFEPTPDTPIHTPVVDFNRDIRPILSNNCFKCHGPDPATREAGLRLDRPEGMTAILESGVAAVVPKDPTASELLARVTAEDDRERMPPNGEPLDAAQVELLRAWITQGAVWQEHWSFVPPVMPPLPDVRDRGWARQELDLFVQKKIEQAGLALAPEADRATLIRRVTLDLTGLPPAPDEVTAFLQDESADAYDRLVQRLLDSPHFGERWASMWLDLARYADTKGYEADRRRTMWPYRDWVVRAFNDDMPFDRFTVEQLAGDLLPDATLSNIIATGFHRNTMTNDEGGTDDEEFRVAAVMDRVSTTMTTWMGLTVACAQCHTHKYDPITQREYYELFAIFNNTADADRMDEAPTLAVLTPEQQRRVDELRRAEDRLVAERETRIRMVNYAEPSEMPELAPGELLFVDDLLPYSLRPDIDRPWPWTGEGLTGSGWTIDASDGFQQRFFTDMYPTYEVQPGDRIVCAVMADPDRPPREIMIQVRTVGNNWEHRAFWGDDRIDFGQVGTPARRHMGDLPPPGQWFRIDFDVSEIGLKPGDRIDGMAFSLEGGRATWDRAGVWTDVPLARPWRFSLTQWLHIEAERSFAGIPESIRPLDASAPVSDALLRHYLEHVHEPTRLRLAESDRAIEQVRAARAAIEDAAPRLPVMRELQGSERRMTRLLEKGSFLNPAEPVEPGVPEVFAQMRIREPTNRLELAGWLMHPDNPLTARVTVNRFWEAFFGRGIVETSEDFGTQGRPPSHPELLDYLAVTFIQSGWSVKELCRQIVTSSTYRQSSRVSAEHLSLDPQNRLLSRFPRLRLEAEMIRDQALAVAGLLGPTIGGPPVYPPQPDGVWMVVYSDDQWTPSTGQDRYRRALYTFWRRTSPYPSMISFDAPSREFCVPRRIRTNTPLQAFVTLNDPVYVEAAQALARRMVIEADAPNPRAIARRGVELCLARAAEPQEIEALVRLFHDEHAGFERDTDAAAKYAGRPPVPAPESASPAELAAWTSVASVLLNLDEFLTKP